MPAQRAPYKRIDRPKVRFADNDGDPRAPGDDDLRALVLSVFEEIAGSANRRVRERDLSISLGRFSNRSARERAAARWRIGAEVRPEAT